MKLFEDTKKKSIITFLIPEKKIDINPVAAFKAFFNENNKGRRVKEFKKKWKGEKGKDCKFIPWNTIIYRFVITTIIFRIAFLSSEKVFIKIQDFIIKFIKKNVNKSLKVFIQTNLGFGLYFSVKSWRNLECCDNCSQSN